MGDRRRGNAGQKAEGVSDEETPASARSAESTTPGGATSRYERRSSERYEVTWSVDCQTEDTFLYAAITNISELGIFVHTIEPLPIGTQLTLRFAPPDSREAFIVQGMGIRFVDLTPEDRERLVDTVRTIAYLRGGFEPVN
ncbi:PilZ domain-containing protein [Polyangium aurulentum]|uniref:PilZ domain-containing protein n=1 Tax=Polyangium aurulentum TaxID=2567896 RepID=UPI00200E9EAD|nr:PilZ domain-containing protein [Polyangium aurulentum]UQA58267.1 PilZ domain-containing protein [Polyangium aurulentum]